MQEFPKVNYRYYIEPSQELPLLAVLDFRNKTTWPMQMQGRVDGENALKDGEGWMFSKFKEWHNSLDLQSKFVRISDYIRSVVKERASVHGSQAEKVFV